MSSRWSRLRGPMITAQSRLGEVTAQSRQGHSSVMARSQLSYGEVTAQSRHLQYDHGSVTARSQLNHGPGHGSVTAGCDHVGHRELTVSSRWAYGELTVSSRWAVTVANFFSWAVFRSPGPNLRHHKIYLITIFNCKTILILKYSLHILNMQNI